MARAHGGRGSRDRRAAARLVRFGPSRAASSASTAVMSKPVSTISRNRRQQSAVSSLGTTIIDIMADRAADAIGDRVANWWNGGSSRVADADASSAEEAYRRSLTGQKRGAEYMGDHEYIRRPVPPQGGYNADIDMGDGYSVPVNSVQVPPNDIGGLPGGPNPAGVPVVLRNRGVQANWRQILRDTRTPRGASRFAVRPLDYKEKIRGKSSLLYCCC